VRKVAVLHREDELELVQELNAAARAAEKLVSSQNCYMEQQLAVSREVGQCASCQAPYLCPLHSQYFWLKPFVSPWPQGQEEVDATSQLLCQDLACLQLRIHTDPWF